MMRNVKVGRLGLGVATAMAVCVLVPGPVAAGASRHTTVTLHPGAKYVAMGSSYAAGYGIKPQQAAPNPCGRSKINYPNLVAKKLGLTLADVSCAGAVTANAIDTPQGTQPPQIDAVTAKTKLVTMTIGGNDVDYIGTAGRCGSHPACAKTFDQDALDAEFTKLPHSLNKLINAIKAKAPSATIVFVAYPRLVPTKTCAALHYTPSGKHLVQSIGSRLEKVFLKVAKHNKIRIADPYPMGEKHGPCASAAKRWVAGNNPVNGATYHPTVAGHREMAKLIEAALKAK